MKYALRVSLPIAAVAMGLAWVSEQVALLLGVEVPAQDLVKFLTDPNVAAAKKAMLGGYAVLLAPVVEEAIFRFGVYRWGCLKGLGGLWRWTGTDGRMAAAVVSGMVFAGAHYFSGGSLATLAVTFLPLWFLGVAFARVYEKTGKLRGAIICHMVFNAVNLTLCLTIGT